MATGGGRSVIVTGASTGIGRACALHLAGLGYRAFAGVRRREDGEALETAGAERLQPVLLDVTDAASIRSAVERVEAQVGGSGLAGLVNNAGIVVAGPLEFLPIPDFRRQLEVNVVGQLAVTQSFLPLLRRGGGRIVNMGSISGRISVPFVGAYSVSKFGLEALSDALRRELLPWGLRVVLVDAGSVATPIWEKSGRAASELEAKLDERARELYGAASLAVRASSRRSAAEGIPAERVAELVAHVLTVSRPRPRYYIGRRTGTRALLARFLPDRLMDRLVLKGMGLPAGP